MIGVVRSSLASVVALASACAPSVLDDPADGTSTGMQTSSTGGATASSGPGESSGTGAMTATTVPGTTSIEGTSGSTDAAGSSSDGCPCSMQEVGIDEPGPDGNSFANIIAELGMPEVEWEWTAVDGQPTTSVRFEIQIAGPPYLWSDGMCGDPSCNFLEGGVRLLVESDDGLLAEDVEAAVWGVLGSRVQLDMTPDHLRKLMGTLPQQMFVDPEGDPVVVDSVGIAGEWNWEADVVASSFEVYQPYVEVPPLVIGRSL